jgi:hypothetical protein
MFINYLIVVSVSFLTIFAVNSTFAEQATGSVTINNFQPIEEGGTLTSVTQQGMIMNFTLPDDISGQLLVYPINIQNSTTDGFSINFLDEVLKISVNPPDTCLTGCLITFVFNESHMNSVGITDPSQVIIYQDSNEDGIFVPLSTILIDDAPAPYAVTATITSTSFFGIGTLDKETFCGKTIQQWKFSGNNILNGTKKDDKLKGTSGVDLILGLDGNDLIQGMDGNDCLIGGNGNDRILGGSGNDVIFGGDGTDVLHGSKGNDVINGGKDNDRITGNSGEDIINGGSDKDKLFGNDGKDNLFGNQGNDELKGGSGNDLLNGGENIDKCDGGHGNNQIVNCEDVKQDKDEDD